MALIFPEHVVLNHFFSCYPEIRCKMASARLSIDNIGNYILQDKTLLHFSMSVNSSIYVALMFLVLNINSSEPGYQFPFFYCSTISIFDWHFHNV